MANTSTPPTSKDVANSYGSGRNGTQRGPVPSQNGDAQSALRVGWGRLGQYWDRYAPFRNPFAIKAQVALDDDVEEGNGVHAITKKTDYWFNRELSLIEEEAKKLAA